MFVGDAVSTALAASRTFSLLVREASVSATHSDMNIRGSIVNTAGSMHNITITARDQYGNSKTSGGERFTLNMREGPQDVNVSSNDNADGTYTLAYTLTHAGSYYLSVAQLGRPGAAPVEVRGSPVRVIVQALSTVDVFHTTAERGVLNRGTRSSFGKEQFFDIIPRDRFSNPLGADVRAAAFQVRFGGRAVSSSLARRPDGSYRVSYIETNKFPYNVSALLKGAPVGRVSYLVSVDTKLGPHAPNCIVSGVSATANVSLEAGKPLPLLVSLRGYPGSARCFSSSS